jgi:hypothetical protein
VHQHELDAHGVQDREVLRERGELAGRDQLAGGIAAALLRQRSQGGSWHVQVSLARTAAWLRSLGRIEGGFTAPRAAFDGLGEAQESGFGRLVALRHAARLSATPVRYARRSVPPGTDRLAWD